jgi:hypothetical protein
MNVFLQAALVFVATMFVDYAWSVYIRSLATTKMLRAAVWSSIIVFAGGFTTIEYISNHWMLIPAMLGAFLGTLLSASLEKKT